MIGECLHLAVPWLGLGDFLLLFLPGLLYLPLLPLEGAGLSLPLQELCAGLPSLLPRLLSLRQQAPLLAQLLLQAVGLALPPPPLPPAIVPVGLHLQFLRQKGGVGEASMQLPVSAGCTVLPLPGPGLQLPEGRIPMLQVGLQLQCPGPLPGQLSLLLL